MTPFIPALIVLALVVLNGLFVAAEFAIVGAPRASLGRRAAQGDRPARTVLRVLQDPRNQDRYIATAQVGITFASLGLGMYGEHMLAHWIGAQLEVMDIPRWIAVHTIASILAITALTYLHIVLGEMVPKALALQHTEPTVIAVTPVMLWIRSLLYPLVMGLNATGNTLLRLVGIDRSRPGQEQYYSADELELVVEESLGSGHLTRSTGSILRELFGIGELTAAAVMAPRVQIHGIPLNAPAEQISMLLTTYPHTRYPVYGDSLDDIVGVVHVRDLARLALAGSDLDMSVVRPVPFIPTSSRLDTVVGRMRDQFVQFVVVLDEFGGTAGIITPNNVRQEIIGGVTEDTERPELFQDHTGRLYVTGTVRLDELSEHLDRTIESEDAETIGGLVLALLQREAHLGDTVEYLGLEIRVTAVDGHGVAEAVIQPHGHEPEEDGASG